MRLYKSFLVLSAFINIVTSIISIITVLMVYNHTDLSNIIVFECINITFKMFITIILSIFCILSMISMVGIFLIDYRQFIKLLITYVCFTVVFITLLNTIISYLFVINLIEVHNINKNETVSYIATTEIYTAIETESYINMVIYTFILVPLINIINVFLNIRIIFEKKRDLNIHLLRKDPYLLRKDPYI